MIDNIVVSYPSPRTVLAPTGIDSDGGGFAEIGRVGAFTEPILSKGLTNVVPRMRYSVDTEGLPSFIPWTNAVTKSDFIWRWSYLNQAHSPWMTNSMSIVDGQLIGDRPISVTNKIGDIEYHYVADVKQTYYKFLDFANDTRIAFPDEGDGSFRLRYPDEYSMANHALTNYFSRIREAVSPWQEMHVVSYVNTNDTLVATNDWTMELISDHTWRGFVFTPTNYAGKTAHIRFVGRNRWESNGEKPSLPSRTWYFPRGEISQIPMGGVADTDLKVLDDTFDPENPEQDIVIDATSGYLMFEFNDESGAFTMNRAEYQDFNKWTPSIKYNGGAAEENKYIGSFVNTSYVGSAKQEFALDMSGWTISQSSSKYWAENFDINADSSHAVDIPFGPNKRTPNGWVASNGMFINSTFVASTNGVSNRALQLQGRGIGSLALINPAEPYQGIGTVSFTARLAQFMDFSDFYCYQDGSSSENYAISAKAAMTNMKQPYSDVSTGSPSLSLVTYYRPSKGCYEFRITRTSAVSPTELWNTKGEMRLDLYKWYKDYNPQTGSSWVCTNLATKTLALGHFLVPPADESSTNETDNANWTGIYFAAYTGTTNTYIEGGVSTTQSKTNAYAEISGTTKMRVISFSDVSGTRHQRGSYGLGACECPGTFGNIVKHNLSGLAEPYKEDNASSSASSKFLASSTDDKKKIQESISNEDWGSVTADRIARWGSANLQGKKYIETYSYGAAASPVRQDLYLSFTDAGKSSDWERKLTVTLDSFATNTVVFSPHTIIPQNIQISVGGDQYSPRTDVVIDDVKFSQWAGQDSVNSLGRMQEWAFTDAWVSRIVEDAYQNAGTENTDDVASVDKCGYYVEKLDDTNYIYVFTNTSAKEVSFVPKQDLEIKELLVLGGGGGGGPGGGGGGGGSAIWVTNTVDYIVGEGGISISVGNGGSGGGSTYKDMKPAVSTAGGTSYVKIKDPEADGSTIAYKGYGGGAGGSFKDGSDAGGDGDGGFAGGGGSARNNEKAANGSVNYASGFGGVSAGGAPGGGGGGGLRGTGGSGSNTASDNGRSVIAAGTNGADGVDGYGGNGGAGFSIEALGDSRIRKVLGELLGSDKAWLGGGGGGGSGESTNATFTASVGAYGTGGQGGGGQGGAFTAISMPNSQNSYANPGIAQGVAGTVFGAGGGGGSFYNPVSTGGDQSRNWIIAGGAGSGGLVAMHVKIKDRLAILQPMRGEEGKPMSIRTPFLNGISLFSFSWKSADANAVLRIQVATNGVEDTSIVNDGTIKNITQDLNERGVWTDICTPISFSRMNDSRRLQGATNILIGLRAPISGVVRLLMDPNVVKEARKPSMATNSARTAYGMVIITGMKVFDEPALDDRSWWGWNIMPTCKLEWSSLYDPDTLGPGRSLGLNFSGTKNSTASADDPLFAEDPDDAQYHLHDPFVQTPRFTNGIGAVMFKARIQETNLNEAAGNKSGWVTISASADPGQEDDAKWDVLTNIEVTASTTVFEPYLFRLTNSISNYQALRLTAWGAAEGRRHQENSGKPFGGNGTENPIPIQRVLIDEVVVTQPMAPKIALKNAYPFRKDPGDNRQVENIDSSDQQPILNEDFGIQVQVVPAGMEDELDVESIRIYMAWYAGTEPWGYENWKDRPYVAKPVELTRAKEWSANNLVYRSNPNDAAAFIPPQMAGEQGGFQIVQYHIWAEYANKSGDPQTHNLSRGDWTLPDWYKGINDYNKLNDTFCAYTVLDSISPRRAWINEINSYDGNLSDSKCQFIEFAVPQGFDMTGWTVQCIKNTDSSYSARQVAKFGYNDVVAHKTANANNSYSFIALQSPNTKAANRFQEHGLDDGTWERTAFESGTIDITNPYALRLQRPTGIIEHEIVFMSTNTATGRSWYTYEGTNLLRKLNNALPGHSWFYVGADAYGKNTLYNRNKSLSLGVYTNHGENASCWANTMQQTPGKVNVTADGAMQYIDPDYFEPPFGTNLWIYANIDSGSMNSLSMVIGNVTNTSAVIIVPQGGDGTFSTSIVYVVKKWFEMDKVVTNEYGKAGGEMPGVSGKNGEWSLDLRGITVSNADNRKFEVTASVKDSSQIAELGDKGIARDDPYYPAVVDWLQNYEEGKIRLAEIWLPNDKPVIGNDNKVCKLNLKQMYWLNIPPVSLADGNDTEDGSDWVFKGGMGSGPKPTLAETIDHGFMTNIRVAVTMMISNRYENTAHAPNMLRGLEPGSTSYDYDEKLGDWNAVTFKITGALQNGKVNKIYRPLRWFTFGPNSFTNGFTRFVDVPDPFSKGSIGYWYEWDKHRGSQIFYRWRIDHDTNRPPITVYQLNDENAFLDPPEQETGDGN